MQNVLNHDVLFEKHFEEISRIPHGSGNEAGVADYLVQFAKDRGFWWHRDALHNVIIKKGGTEGYEYSPPVLMQAHTDMVCVKDKGVEHDFLRDPLKLVLEGRILRAEGTSLGADDIAGVATILALLEREGISHPPIEAVFTTQEETGMFGAQALDYSLLTARRMISLDSGGESESSVNAASCLNLELCKRTALDKAAGQVCRLGVTGLQGGHSGMCIDLERGNALLIAARILHELGRRVSFRISRFDADNASNVIPSECFVSFICKDEDAEAVAGIVAKSIAEISREYQESDPGLLVSLSQTGGSASALSREESRTLVELLCLLPNGRAHRSLTVEGFVTASSNIAAIAVTERGWRVKASIRAELESRLDCLLDKMAIAAGLCGATLREQGRTPAWVYMPGSAMRARAAQLMEQEWGVPLKPSFEHGGLECGYFSKNLPGLDIYVIGPIGRDVHSTNEHLDLDSADRVYEFLTRYLALLRD